MFFYILNTPVPVDSICPLLSPDLFPLLLEYVRFFMLFCQTILLYLDSFVFANIYYLLLFA